MLKNAKILVCDDSILARKQVKDVITASLPDAVFEEAANGQEAVDKFKSFGPDLVLLDIVMPVKDGNSAIKEIIAANAEAKIIVVSSVGTQSQLRDAITAGAKDFVQKPVDAAKMSKILQTQLEG